MEAAVWEWQGTFLQLSGELDEAKKAYERCGKAVESRGEPWPADCLIKMGWVCMEKEDTEAVSVTVVLWVYRRCWCWCCWCCWCCCWCC